MAQKTMVGGTVYEIKGGKTLVDGTAYSIKSGKTLVDGTAYEVGFAATITLTFFKNSLSNQSIMTSVIIEGITYPLTDGGTPDMTTKEIVVPIGTVIICKTLRGSAGIAKITLNGETVVSGVGEYEYTVVRDATIHSTGTMSGPTAEHSIINIIDK